MTIIETMESEIKAIMAKYPQVHHDDAQAALVSVSTAMAAGNAKAKSDVEALMVHASTVAAALAAIPA